MRPHLTQKEVKLMDFGAMFGLWQTVLTKPNETIAAEAKKTNVGFGDGLMLLGVAAAIVSVIGGIVNIIMQSIGGALGIGLGTSSVGRVGVDIVASVIAIPVNFIIIIIASFVALAIYHVIASVLGGKSDLGRAYYMIQVVESALLAASILTYIPCAGMFIGLALGLYGLYLLTMMFNATYAFNSTFKAALVWAIPMAIVIVLAVIAIAILGVGMLGLGALGAGLSSY